MNGCGDKEVQKISQQFLSKRERNNMTEVRNRIDYVTVQLVSHKATKTILVC